MPKVSTGGTTDEEIEEWLGRIEETEPLPDTIAEFTAELTSQLSAYDPDQQVRMIEALWSAKERQTDYTSHGIRQLIVRYPWGSEIRYGVKGMSGLWGWESLQDIRSEEGW